MSTDDREDERAEAAFRVGRRRFLAGSALASSALIAGPAAVGLAGCGTLGSAMSSRDALALETRLDVGLGRLRNTPRGAIARELSWHPHPQVAEDVLKQTLEALVVADVARSLPPGRAPTALSTRLGRELHVVSRATDTHHALLTTMPGSARRRLDTRIRREPEIPSQVAGWIDRNAAELGTARESRLKLRQAAHDVSTRLRRQSANAVIDDCVAKVERAASRAGTSLAVTRSTRVSLLLRGIWQQADAVPRPSGRALTPPGPSTHIPVPPAGGSMPPTAAPSALARASQELDWARFTDTSDRVWSARWARPGDREIAAGAVMMPFGLASCGAMLLVGLIVMIAGSVANANWDGSPRGY